MNLLNPELLAKDNFTNAELVEHMCNTQLGVGFVNKQMGLPRNTFASNDAITWLMNNIKSLSTRKKAVERLQVTFFFFPPSPTRIIRHDRVFYRFLLYAIFFFFRTFWAKDWFATRPEIRPVLLSTDFICTISRLANRQPINVCAII